MAKAKSLIKGSDRFQYSGSLLIASGFIRGRGEMDDADVIALLPLAKAKRIIEGSGGLQYSGSLLIASGFIRRQ